MKIPTILLIIGVVLMVLSVIVPVVIWGQQGPGMGIIGGAGWPTFWMLFQQYSMWLSGCGAVLAAVAAVLLIKRRNK